MMLPSLILSVAAFVILVEKSFRGHS